MKCPVCLEEIKPKLVETYTDPIEKKEYKIYSCPACEVEFSDPMKNPGPEWYQQFTSLWGYQGKEKLLPNWRIKFLKELPKTKKRPKLLDIGCGYGDFLVEANRLGYEVTGVDFDEEKVKVAKSKGLTNIYSMDFEQFYQEKFDKFDVITFFQLLEHLEDPSTFIDMVKDMIYPGGYIMLDLPNRQRVLRAAAGIIDYPPHHLTRWTPNSLFEFLRRKKFEIVTTTTVYPIKYFYDNLFLLFSINILALIKKFIFKRKKFNELKTIPIDHWTDTRVFLKQNIRRLIIKIIKHFYYLLVLPTIIVVLPLLAYLRKKNRGLFIFVIARIQQ